MLKNHERELFSADSLVQGNSGGILNRSYDESFHGVALGYRDKMALARVDAQLCAGRTIWADSMTALPALISTNSIRAGPSKK